MLKRNHFLWTLGISPWVYNYLSFEIKLVILLTLITAFLSSLPDIDLKIVKYFKSLNNKTFYISYPIYILVKLIFRHRTITHSLFIPALMLYIYHTFKLDEYLSLFILSLSIALILHVFEDLLTIAGVKIFWPIPITFRLARFKTASKFHNQILHLTGLMILVSFPIFYLI